jgi:hypothetical protein
MRDREIKNTTRKSNNERNACPRDWRKIGWAGEEVGDPKSDGFGDGGLLFVADLT